eukprot:773299-Alexandrium_andersonii.AAC.1
MEAMTRFAEKAMLASMAVDTHRSGAMTRATANVCSHRGLLVYEFTSARLQRLNEHEPRTKLLGASGIGFTVLML